MILMPGLRLLSQVPEVRLYSVCNEVACSFAEVWKIHTPVLAYVTAEVLRPMLVRILPKHGIVLVPHDHFGMDLAPGLSIKLDAVYLPDAVDFEGVDNGKTQSRARGIHRTGQHPCT